MSVDVEVGSIRVNVKFALFWVYIAELTWKFV